MDCLYRVYFIHSKWWNSTNKNIGKVALVSFHQRHFPILGALRCFPRILKTLELKRSFFSAVQLLLSEISASSSRMRLSWEFYRSNSVLIAYWSISCETYVKSRGKVERCSRTCTSASFESGAWDGVVVRTTGSLTLSSCPLISSGTREFAFICWRLGPKVFDILCFSVSSKEFVLFVVSLKTWDSGTRRRRDADTRGRGGTRVRSLGTRGRNKQTTPDFCAE